MSLSTGMAQYPPSVAECLDLMEEHGMLANIRQHSMVVARGAENLYERLDDHQRSLPEKSLIIAGALLHDIAKTACLNTTLNHAQAGSDLCMKLGFPEIAEIVREHVFLTEFSTPRYQQGIFFAKELIYYTDKRVLHTEIVSLDKRLDYILNRYGNNSPHRYKLIRENFNHCLTLESYLCRCTGCSAEELLVECDKPATLTRDLL